MTIHSQLKRPSKKGFTLIELLTVIAIIAILAAILVPTVSDFRKTARQTVDMTKLRQIANASLILASENQEQLPRSDREIGTASVVPGAITKAYEVAAVLAVEAGLNDLSIWVSASDGDAIQDRGLVVNIKNSGGVDPDDGDYEINPDLVANPNLSFDFVADLTMSTPPTTPLAFSRMSDTSASTWGATDIYGSEGGHVVFVGGYVDWFETLEAELVDGEGTSADSIDDAIANLPSGTALILDNS